MESALASVYAPKGTIIGFATSPGEIASDGVGRNGTYTDALLQHIDTPDYPIEAMFKRVRNTVAAASGGRQTTWEHTSLAGEFYFSSSLGKLITEYEPAALADNLFIIDKTKKSHEVIAGLKTHTWPRQNPAVALLDAASVGGMAKNNLFVIGRNLYQAACGGSHSAQIYISNFANVTNAYDPTKRKAILDGILFEIFFNNAGELRKKIKQGYFSKTFELQRFTQFQASFAFISKSLTVVGARFHVIPGTGQELAATVSTKKTADGFSVEAVYVAGENVLRAEEDARATKSGEPRYYEVRHSYLKDQLSEQLVVPLRLLKLTYTPSEAGSSETILFPLDWTVCRSWK